MHRHFFAAVMTAVLVMGTACGGDTKEVSDSATSRQQSDERSADSNAGGTDDDAEDTDGTGNDGDTAGSPATTSDASDSSSSDGARSGDSTIDSDAAPGPDTGGTGGRSEADAGGSAAGAGGAGGSAGDAGGSADRSAPAPAPGAAPAPAPPDPGRYQRYLSINSELGGAVATLTEATALAALFCNDPAGSKATYLNGQPLSAYPSDLALVRAYCPDMESRF